MPKRLKASAVMVPPVSAFNTSGAVDARFPASRLLVRVRMARLASRAATFTTPPPSVAVLPVIVLWRSVAVARLSSGSATFITPPPRPLARLPAMVLWVMVRVLRPVVIYPA
jgi:hypothetical protein